MNNCQLKNGQTLVFREANKQDASIIIDYLNKVGTETDNLTFGEGGFGISADREASFIESISKSDNQLMLCAFIEGKLVGQLGFTGGSRPRIKHVGEFGVTVLKDYWNQGIGTAALEQLIKWAKASNVVRKINMRVRSDNYGAIHVYEKLRFHHDGLITRDFYIGGKFYDSIHMGLEID